MDAHATQLFNEFIEKKTLYETIEEVARTSLEAVIKKNGLYICALESRVKDENSLKGKLELKGYKYKTVTDVTDLVGMRVVVFYEEEVDKFAGIVEKLFKIDRENSVDKRQALASDQFGYMSLHYICSLPTTLYFDKDHPEINDMRFELQIRTVLQHAWATAFHDTGYKSDIAVPKKYIRSLSRLAGLLEIADEEISSILREIAEYRRGVKNLIQDGSFEDLELNGDTFARYLEIGPFDALNDKIASINRAEIFKTNLSKYLAPLKLIGCKTLGDVEKLKAENSEDAYKLAVLQLGGTDLDILSSEVGLQNICEVKMVKLGEGEAGLVSLLDAVHGERESNKKAAARLLRQIESLGIASELSQAAGKDGEKQ